MIDCIVVGAGLAGLVATRELVRHGSTVLLLEARDRVGGRIENQVLEDNQVVELGGQWVIPGNQRLMDELSRAGLELVGPSQGDMLVRMGGTNQRLHSDASGTHQLTPFDVADLGQGLLRFTRLAERLAEDESWARTNALWLDQDLERWCSSNLRTPTGREVFRRALARSVPDQHTPLSLRAALTLSSAGIDLEQLVAASGSVRQMRVVGGVWQLCERFAEELDDQLKLSTPVSSIRQKPEHVEVLTLDGEVHKARHVVLAIPAWLTPDLIASPPMPQWRVQSLDKMRRSNVIKAFLVYPTPWWKTDGWSGQMGADQGQVRVTFDTSDEHSGYGVLMGFFDGEQAVQMHALSPEGRERAFVNALTEAYGDKARHPIAYRERDWLAEPYTRGCNGAHFVPGEWSLVGPLLAEPMDRIFFAGAEYAERFNGYMEGAYRSGEKAAAQVLRSDHARVAD